MKKIWLVVLVLVVVAIAAFWGYRKFFKEPGAKVLETARVERADIRGILVETGIVKSQVGAVVKVGARVTGTIMQMNVKVGDRVDKGDLVALIDDREDRKQLERLKAALLSAENTLKQIQLTYPQRIREARANHDYAKINFTREQELLKSEYTTRDAVDKARNEFEATESNLKRLQEEFKTQTEITKANIDEISAQIKQIEVRLSYSRIHSPISGVIAEVTAQEGETIVTGLQVGHLFTVLDPTSLEMWIYVDETDIGKCSVGQGVEYYVDTFPDRTFHGTIGKIYPQPVVKDNIVYYVAVVEVPKADAEFLRPEMTSHVKIIFEEKKDVLTVPNAAIKFEEGRQVVYRVMGPGRVEKAIVGIGLRGEDRTEILSGVAEGEELATKLILPVTRRP